MTIAPPADLAPRIASDDPEAFPIPNGREEEWRFAPLDRLATFFHAVDDASTVSASGSHITMREPGARLTTWTPTNRPSAIARASAKRTVSVHIAAEEQVPEPILVDLRAEGSSAYQDVEIVVERFASATVVLSLDLTADVSGAIVTDVRDGAELTLILVVDGPQEHCLFSDVPLRLGRDATVTAAAIVLGGGAVRLQPSVHYAGPGGSAELLGAFLVEGDRFVEQRVFVEHEVPNCRSRVVYKGALSGADARSVWIGDVLVRRTATGTDTYELNRNLLLDDGPRADSVPNLELETGEVAGAGHASATGRFDDEQLFYLMSRGIPEPLARQLVVRGFFAEVVARIPSATWRTEIMTKIERRLGLEHIDD